MGMPGPLELIIILVIVVLVFGGKRLKNLGGDLGGAIKGFKKSMKDEAAEKRTEQTEEIIEAETEKEETSKQYSADLFHIKIQVAHLIILMQQKTLKSVFWNASTVTKKIEANHV